MRAFSVVHEHLWNEFRTIFNSCFNFTNISILHRKYACQTKVNTTAEFLFQVHSFNKDNSMLKASRKFTDKVLVFDLIAFWKSIGPVPKGTLDHIQKRFDHMCQTNIFEWCGKKYPQALHNQVKTR